MTYRPAGSVEEDGERDRPQATETFLKKLTTKIAAVRTPPAFPHPLPFGQSSTYEPDNLLPLTRLESSHLEQLSAPRAGSQLSQVELASDHDQ